MIDRVSTTLLDIGLRGYTLTRPIPIIITWYDDDDIFVWNYEVAVSGAGEVETEAIQEFKLNLISYYEELAQFPSRLLGESARTHCAILSSLIQKDDAD